MYYHLNALPIQNANKHRLSKTEQKLLWTRYEQLLPAQLYPKVQN